MRTSVGAVASRCKATEFLETPSRRKDDRADTRGLEVRSAILAGAGPLYRHPGVPRFARAAVRPPITPAHEAIGTRVVPGREDGRDQHACPGTGAPRRRAHTQRDGVAVRGSLTRDEASRLGLTIGCATVVPRCVAVVAGLAGFDAAVAAFRDAGRREACPGATTGPQR